MLASACLDPARRPVRWRHARGSTDATARRWRRSRGAALAHDAIAAGGAHACCFNGMFVADPMGDVLKLFALRRRGASCCSTRATTCASASLFAASTTCWRSRRARHHGDHLGRQPPDDLPRASSCMSLSLYAMVAFDRESPDRRGSRDEVLRARRDRLGHAALRHFDHLRRHRQFALDDVGGALRRATSQRRRSCSGSPSSSSASHSSSARCRSTCGSRTCTTARRRR